MKLWAIIPELIIAGSALFYIPVAGWVKGKNQLIPTLLTLVSLLTALGFSFMMLSWPSFDIFNGTYAIDNFGTVFKILILSGSIITLLLLLFYFKKNSHIAHAPIALLLSTLGAMCISSSMDLGLIVLFLQMMSLAGYVLVGIIRKDNLANEASLKFFIFAAVALAVMAFGLTFLYGLTGSLDLRIIGVGLISSNSVWIFISLILILIGYGFEITLVPFHFWAPDVYAGSTAPVAGFISVVPKIAGFAGLLRFLLTAYQGNIADWSLIIAIFAAVTMTLGNLTALRQTKLKRLLAYSSIAQSGLILMAIAASDNIESAASFAGFYLIAYIFMNLGAFSVISQIERNFGSDDIILFRGLGRSSPFSAVVLVFSLLSLAGIPPLAGFAGKVFLISAAIDRGYIWLVIITAINLTIALYYYVSVAAEVYLKQPENKIKPVQDFYYLITAGICTAGTIFFGIFPAAGLNLTNLISNLLR